jgi:hypothetical protein
MSDTDANVEAAVSATEKYRAGEAGEVGTALVVVGLGAERGGHRVAQRSERRVEAAMVFS